MGCVSTEVQHLKSTPTTCDFDRCAVLLLLLLLIAPQAATDQESVSG